jgi:isopentenyl diphosphate isomerase/L-lactate dehydrogenase-like FMN-dependent dehydrogenase/cytochrome b561
MGAASRAAAPIRPFVVRPALRMVPRLQLAPLRANLSTSAEAPVAYSRQIQWLHWGMGGGTIACLALTWAAKDAKPEMKAFLMKWHSQIGLLVLAAIVPRVAIRLTSKQPAHLPGPIIEVMASRFAHGAMYFLLGAVPLTGAAMFWLSGNSLPFFGLSIPGKKNPTENDQANAKKLGGLHTVQLGPLFEILIPLHIGAVGYHIMMNKDPLARMMTPSMANAVNQLKQVKPGPLAAGLAFGGVAAVWLSLTMKDYAVSFAMSGGPIVVAAPKSEGGGVMEIDLEEVEKHNKPDDLWLAVDGQVYDLTKYHPLHPGAGGPAIIIKNAGTDATTGFMKAKHSPKAMGLRDTLKIGPLKRNLKSELNKVLNCDDMQARATQLLTPGALAYYDAGAEDMTSRKEALECWDRDWRLRPRNFIDVGNVDTGCTLLGQRLEAPIMAAPTALLKMGHPDGEAAVARGCQLAGVGNCLSTTASLSIEDVAAASPDCYRWFQLYVYKDHEKTKRLVQRATKEGYSAICLTVDLPVLGNRTSLKRIGFTVPKEFKMANVVGEKETAGDKAAAKAGVNVKDPGDRAAYVAKLYDQSLTLELLTWIGEMTHLPIVVKGILRGDSAALCAAHPNVRGIIVSNHGGRQLDNCLAPLTALPDVVMRVNECNLVRAKQGLEPVEIIVDGGVTRGRGTSTQPTL